MWYRRNLAGASRRSSAPTKFYALRARAFFCRLRFNIFFTFALKHRRASASASSSSSSSASQQNRTPLSWKIVRVKSRCSADPCFCLFFATYERWWSKIKSDTTWFNRQWSFLKNIKATPTTTPDVCWSNLQPNCQSQRKSLPAAAFWAKDWF